MGTHRHTHPQQAVRCVARELLMPWLPLRQAEHSHPKPKPTATLAPGRQ